MTYRAQFQTPKFQAAEQRAERAGKQAGRYAEGLTLMQLSARMNIKGDQWGERMLAEGFSFSQAKRLTSAYQVALYKAWDAWKLADIRRQDERKTA
jgi:predicted transposase YdaD